MHPSDIQRFYRVQAPIYDLTRRAFLFHRRRAIELLDVRSGDEVADFGCGTGLNFPLLEKTKARKFYGVDASTAMLKRASQKSLNVSLFEGDLMSFRMERPVDRIVSTYVLSMIEDWEKALENMIQALKPNGTLVILDFAQFRSVLRPFNPFLTWWLRRFGVHHKRDLQNFFEDHFENVYVETFRAGYAQIFVGRNPILLR